MTLYHPHVLADKLEGLLPELQRWSHRARMALDNAQVQQKRREDRTLQIGQSVQGQEYQLAQDQKYVQQDEELLLVCARACQEVLAGAQQTARVAQSILNNAQTAYDRLQRALQSARGALMRAEQALLQATANVASKRAEFANVSLDGGKGDGPAIRRQLSVAEEVQRQASGAVQAVSVQVTNCERAVALANEALQLAKVAYKQAQAGLKASEDSLEFVRAASRALEVGKQALGKEEVAVNAVVGALQHATQIAQEASVQLVGARSHEQPAQLHAADEIRSLLVKIGLLLFIDRPELPSDPMVALLELGAVADTGEQLAQILNARLERLVVKLDNIDDLKPYRWSTLSLEQRAEVLQKTHNMIASIYSFKPCSVEVKVLPPTIGGFHYRASGRIEISRNLVASNDRVQPLQTLLHESRHAYQWKLAQCFQQSFGWLSNADWTLAQVWSDNFGGYQYPEQGGSLAYRNQPVEVDARNFAEMVIRLWLRK